MSSHVPGDEKQRMYHLSSALTHAVVLCLLHGKIDPNPWVSYSAPFRSKSQPISPLSLPIGSLRVFSPQIRSLPPCLRLAISCMCPQLPISECLLFLGTARSGSEYRTRSSRPGGGSSYVVLAAVSALWFSNSTPVTCGDGGQASLQP